MRFQGNFETLSILKKGNHYHMVMDFTKGQLLERWLRQDNNLDCKKAKRILQELCLLINAYQRNSLQQFRYISTYTILIGEIDEKLYLIDLEAETNTEIKEYLIKMHDYNNLLDIDGDFIDFSIIAKILLANPYNPIKLSKIQSHRFHKIIKKCQKNPGEFRTFLEIEQRLAEIKE